MGALATGAAAGVGAAGAHAASSKLTGSARSGKERIISDVKGLDGYSGDMFDVQQPQFTVPHLPGFAR